MSSEKGQYQIMLLKSLVNRDSKYTRKLLLHFVLVVPFVLQIFAAVGLTGYLSFRNGQKAINDLAIQLQNEVSERVRQHLDTYLATPRQINQINLDAIELGLVDLQDLPTTGHYFWKQMQVFDVGYINYGSKNGQFIGVERVDDGTFLIHEVSENSTLEQSINSTTYSYTTDSQGNRTKLLYFEKGNDHRSEPWYKDAVQADKATWTQIYQWEEKPEVLSISSSYPVYNRSGKLIGIIGIDLILSQIKDFLSQLKISPSGKTFIAERNGLLVASSSTEQPFTMVNGKAQRLKAADSKDPLIKATARQLLKQFTNLSEIKASRSLSFTLNGQRQFTQVTPWRDKFGLDWLIVVAVPESDFMARIDANTRTSILLCLGALGLATVLGIYTSRWIARPVLQLSEASKIIASGDLDKTVEEAKRLYEK